MRQTDVWTGYVIKSHFYLEFLRSMVVPWYQKGKSSNKVRFGSIYEVTLELNKSILG